MTHTSTAHDPQVLRLDQALTIYTAANTRVMLNAALLGQPHLRLDLSAVADIDTAGFQLLLAAARQAQAAGGSLGIAAASACVRQIVAFYGAPEVRVD